jgi:hypothetical protein
VTPPVTPPQASVTVTGSSISAAANNRASADAFDDQSIGFSVANRPSSGLWSRVTVAGGVPWVEADVVWQALGEGKMRVIFPPPTTLAAGTYTGTAKLEICTDATCTQHVAGSPVNIPITLVISGNALPATQVHWSQDVATGAEFVASETRVPHIRLRISVSHLAYDGIYLRRTVSSTGLITGAVFGQPTFSTTIGTAFGQYDITLKPPASVGSGIFNDTMQFRACFDPACASPVPDGLFTVSLNVVIPATEGVEFTRRSLPPSTAAQGVVWSPIDQSLLVDASAGTARKIMQVNPQTMATGTSTTLPETGLRNMVVTPDGSNLYVGSTTGSFVHRLQLPFLTKDLTVSLGYSASLNPLKVNDLAVVPGQPQSFLVALEHNNGNHGGVVAYDNAVARPVSIGVNPAQGFELARWLVPAPTAGNFISLVYGPSQPVVNTLDQLTLGAMGISASSSVPFSGVGLVRYFPKPQRVGTKLFLNDGTVLDAVTGAVVGTLPSIDSGGAYAMLADDAKGRLFVLQRMNSLDYLLSYDAATLKLLALIPVYAGPSFPPGIGRSVTLWGNDGLAITDGAQLIVLSGTFFSTYRGEPTM